MAGAGTYPSHHHNNNWPPSTAPQQPPFTPPPGAPPFLAANPNNRPPPDDEVRTVFITGLPEDVKERELQNLLRWFPGYEASQVNNKGEQPLGFVLFSTPHYAFSARDTLQDLIFDAELKSVLHAEMAKKNLYVKRGIVADTNSYDQSKRLRTGGDYNHSGYTSPSAYHTPPAPPPVWGPHGYMAQAPQQYNPYGGYTMPPVPMHPPPHIPSPSNYVPVQNAKDNPPCNTLFIGNLGVNISEEELRGLISVQPGFRQMKVMRQERHTVCFIEFEDVNSAANVHRNLQGAVIPSSGSVGMRIQYSKNPFGKRKDGSYPLFATGTNGTPKNMAHQ